MMQVEFTQHALARMRERGRLEAQGWIDRAGKRMLLRVICEQGMVVTVVTVMTTSKLEKYGVVP